MKPLLLIIDDDNEFIEDFILLLGNDFNCLKANNEIDGLRIISEKSPDVVLLDLMFDNGDNGIDILKKIMEVDDTLPVVMITDYASLNTAIDAIKIGAVDYISKTPNLNELKLIIQRSLKQRLQKLRIDFIEDDVNRKYGKIIGSSKVTRELKEKIKIYSENQNTVLITGESGVGKELVARQIHYLSDRNEKPFIGLNCAALPKDLIESELFGYERGAFTGANKRKPGKFELAEDGTLFLDEISELTAEAQVKLLRVLQEKEFERVGGVNTIPSNCRLIAATNKDLFDLVKEGKFREDLYYRLDVLPLRVPPLRERVDDIKELISFFIKRSAIEMKKEPKEFPMEHLEKFTKYNWPGNIRELQNQITRFMILPHGAYDFTLSSGLTNTTPDIVIPQTWQEMDELRKNAAEKASREIETLFLKNILKKFDNNISKTAEYIGINRSNLHKMIKKCGL